MMTCEQPYCVRPLDHDGPCQFAREDLEKVVSKHTPGPWTMEAWAGWHIRLGSHKRAQWVNVYEKNQDSEANARLIAAAPELLEALRGLLAVTERGLMISDRYDAALAAIAKVEGKTPSEAVTREQAALGEVES